jgi:hypothetical protein
MCEPLLGSLVLLSMRYRWSCTLFFVAAAFGQTPDSPRLVTSDIANFWKAYDASEINAAFRKAMGTSDHIPLMMIHELTHMPAKQVSQRSIALASTIGEGAADFMTERVASGSINAYQKEWAEAHR